MSGTTTFARMRRDGSLVRMNPDGTEEGLPVGPLAPMSAAAIEACRVRSRRAAAHGGRLCADATGALGEGLALRSWPHTGGVRSPHIPLGTLHDWRTGPRRTDQPAHAYLTVADVVFAAPADAEEDDLGRKPARNTDIMETFQTPVSTRLMQQRLLHSITLVYSAPPT